MIDHVIGFLAILTAILIILALLNGLVGVFDWFASNDANPWMVAGIFAGGAVVTVSLGSLLMWASR